MGLFSTLLGSTPQGIVAESAGKAVEGLMSGVGDLGIKIREAIKGKELDPAVRASLEAAAIQADTIQAQAQAAINLVDAQSGRFFQSGWRPNIGWACGAAIWYSWVIQPFLAFGVQVAAWSRMAEGAPFPPLPILSMSDVVGLVFALLGMSTLRTYERVQGKA